MGLKITIIILFIAVIASLSSGLVFLLKNYGTSDSKQTLYALGIRITLAALLLICIFYGLYSGQLHSTAPWDARI